MEPARLLDAEGRTRAAAEEALRRLEERLDRASPRRSG